MKKLMQKAIATHFYISLDVNFFIYIYIYIYIAFVKENALLNNIFVNTHCREKKFPTYHKLTYRTTKSTKYGQVQSATYYN